MTAEVMVTPWQRRAVNVLLVLGVIVAVLVTYVAFVQRGQSTVLTRVDNVTRTQQESAESTECSREITSAGEVAQIDSLENLAAAFLDLTADGDVSEQTRSRVAELLPRLEAARAGYESINEVCPVPD